MDLYIIRHAQSTNNALPIEVEQRDRVCDPLLTELGHHQAELLAKHLATGRDGWTETAASADPEAGGGSTPHSYGITHLVCSPMKRTLLTTQPISRALGLQPEIWLDIHEHGGIYLDHGAPMGRVGYPGITRQELLARFPGYDAPDGLTDQGWWRDGFEEWDICLARAAHVARRLRERCATDARIAMVTHGAFASALIMALVGTPPDAGVHFSHHNTGISLVRFRPDGGIRLRYLNRVPHLRAELVT
jgi:broad specificity phosphatase PhoE